MKKNLYNIKVRGQCQEEVGVVGKQKTKNV